jgi:hypothetical protein
MFFITYLILTDATRIFVMLSKSKTNIWAFEVMISFCQKYRRVFAHSQKNGNET